MITPDVFWGGTVVIIVLLVIGYIWLKKHNAAAAATVSSDVQTAGRDIVAEFDKLKAWLESKFASSTTTAPPPASTAPPPAAAPAAAAVTAHFAARPATAVSAAPTGAVMYELTWDPNGGITSDNSHSVAPGQVTTWHFRTPAKLGTGGGAVQLVEHDNSSGGSAQPCPYYGALNTTPGDCFTQLGPTMNSGAFNGSVEPRVEFKGSQPNKKGSAPAFVLEANTDYYFNVACGDVVPYPNGSPTGIPALPAGVSGFAVLVQLIAILPA